MLSELHFVVEILKKITQDPILNVLIQISIPLHHSALSVTGSRLISKLIFLYCAVQLQLVCANGPSI